jgi:hypothetical protein
MSKHVVPPFVIDDLELNAWIQSVLDRILANDLGSPSALESAHGPESVHGTAKWRDIDWVMRLVGKAPAVARIDFRADLDDGRAGRASGTGSLMDARGLGFKVKSKRDRFVLVTCNHVMCDPAVAGATKALGRSRHPDLMTVRFQWRNPDKVYRVEVVFQSPIDQLDITIARLVELPSEKLKHDFQSGYLEIADKDPPISINRPGPGRPPKPRLFCLHHPEGAALKLSFEDNNFVRTTTRDGTSWPVFLLYRCPTSWGSSGSPVLDELQRVVAVHRAGAETLHDGEQPKLTVKGKRGANEGTSIQSVRQAVLAWEAEKTLLTRAGKWLRGRLHL